MGPAGTGSFLSSSNLALDLPVLRFLGELLYDSLLEEPFGNFHLEVAG